MNIIIKQVTGWKWDTLEDVEKDDILCRQYFNLGSETTSKVLGPIPSYKIVNNETLIEFYFVAVTEPSQLTECPNLDNPTSFIIQQITE